MHKGLWIICVDQLSYEYLGCYNNKWISTPNIDKFAQNSLIFNKAYCASPLCVPSRYSMYTGKYPSYHGCLADDIPLTKPTIFNHLKDIETCAVGKLDFRGNQNQYHGIKHRPNAEKGAQDIYERKNSSSFIDNTPHYFDINRPEDEQCKIISETSADYLNNTKEDFLLFTSFLKPHEPHDPPKKFWEIYKTRKFHHPKMRAYSASVSCVDHYFGYMMSLIKSLKDILIIFLADHGEMGNTYNQWGKHCLYEQAIRIPFMINFENEMKGTSNRLTSTLDLYPTICEYFGLPYSNLDGTSLFKDNNKPHKIENIFW